MMRTLYSKLIGLLAISLGFMICACANTSLEDYVPNNQAEADIVALLIRYQNARKNFDLESYLDCLHDQGVFHYASRIMVSKQQLSALLPEFWMQLQKGSRSFFPMCRENLSGNYFVSFRLANPKIIISQTTAEAVVTYVNTGWRLKHYISLIKENNQWLIIRLDWETG